MRRKVPWSGTQNSSTDISRPQGVHKDEDHTGEFLPEDSTEIFKFQILINHLECVKALLVVDSTSTSVRPYTHAMEMLTEMYKQPDTLLLLAEWLVA